ncbi:MAG TPA: hypothetical protein VFB38_16565 [Chthonomonadaceae bacterium]|nr:hypothetical protein [Chthonomonadaceae bacterium]
MRKSVLSLLSVPALMAACGLTLPALRATMAPRSMPAGPSPHQFVSPGGAHHEPIMRLLGNLTDTRIAESSGLTASRRTPGVLWTHNDSGDGPYLYALDRKGRTLARYTVPNATNVDWEDIAIGPGADGKPALYIGDIGDNSHHRDDTAVYRIPEPKVDASQTAQEAVTAPAEKLPYVYPDGYHDAETLMVHPKTGEVFLVTKESSGVSGVYAFLMPLTPGIQTTLRRVGTLRFASSFTGTLGLADRLATAGDIAPDGSRLVVRTYLRAYEWAIAPGQSVAGALAGKPRWLILPFTRQGESICYRLDGRAWLLTSEGASSPLYEILLP